jgi:hypothetical protein
MNKLIKAKGILTETHLITCTTSSSEMSYIIFIPYFPKNFILGIAFVNVSSPYGKYINKFLLIKNNNNFNPNTST